MSKECRFLSDAHLETHHAAFVGQKGVLKLPAQQVRAGVVRLRSENSLPVHLGAAGDVFKTTGEAVGDDNLGDGLSALVGEADEEGNDIADQSAALVRPFDDLERLGEWLLDLFRGRAGLDFSRADARGNKRQPVDPAGDGGAHGYKSAGS